MTLLVEQDPKLTDEERDLGHELLRMHVCSLLAIHVFVALRDVRALVRGGYLAS